MKVIIESGATKSDWRVIDDNGREHMQFKASGTNVSTMSVAAVCKIMTESCGLIAREHNDISEVYLYTAGVLTDRITSEVIEAVAKVFPHAFCDVQTDLIGAVRAACGHEPGIAAILGTGSNSCQYDGNDIVRRVYSGGFILGDEGSAATLGKLFISDFLKGMVPEYIAKDFSCRFPSDYATVTEMVYRNPESPSSYLGSFAPFIMEYYHDPYIRELVDGNFRTFIRRCIRQYDYDRYPVGVVGGFGYALREIFSRVASEEGVTVSSFYPEPIEGLIKYHTER